MGPATQPQPGHGDWAVYLDQGPLQTQSTRPECQKAYLKDHLFPRDIHLAVTHTP
jgi:hypothetical protein